MAIEQVPRIVRVTWKYDLNAGGGAADTSQHSVCYQAGATPPDSATTDAVLHDMANAALASQAAHVDPGSFSPSVVCTGSRVALEGTNGHTLFEQFGVATGPLAFSGSGGGKSLPWETSFAVSLYAYQPGVFDPFGKSKRGRFYLPPMQSDLLDSDNSGRMAGASAVSIADTWGTVLQELQEHDYSGFPAFSPVLVVNSRKTPARPAWTPEAFPVTFLRFDTKIDSQRRRQRQEPAPVGTAPYPA